MKGCYDDMFYVLRGQPCPYQTLKDCPIDDTKQYVVKRYGVAPLFTSSFKKKTIISIDPSTSQTGIVISSMSGKPLYMLDLINIMPTRHNWIDAFRRWCIINFPIFNPAIILHEEVNHNAPQKYVKQLLSTLVEVIYEVKAVTGLKYDIYEVNNSAYKRYYLSDPKYSGRRKERELVKEALYERTVELYPQFNYYVLQSLGHDSCDAMGIVYGFFRIILTSDLKFMKVNKSTMPKRSARREPEFIFVNKSEINKIKEKLNISKLSIIAFNDDFSFQENVDRLSASKYTPCCLIPYSQKSLDIFKWQSTRDDYRECVLLVK